MRWARLEHKAAALARDARVAGVLVREVGLAAAVASVAGEAVRAVGAHVRRGALACDARVTGVLVREVGLAAVVWTKGRGCECWAAGECWMVDGGWWVVGGGVVQLVGGGRWTLAVRRCSQWTWYSAFPHSPQVLQVLPSEPSVQVLALESSEPPPPPSAAEICVVTPKSGLPVL